MNSFRLQVFGSSESINDFSKEYDKIGNLIHFCTHLNTPEGSRSLIYVGSEDVEELLKEISNKYINLRFILTKFDNIDQEKPNVTKYNNLKIIDKSQIHVPKQYKQHKIHFKNQR